MNLNFTSSIVIFLGLITTWFILFSILSEKKPLILGLKIGVLVLACLPFIANLSQDLYASISRQWFILSGANGEINLAYSPMRVPNLKNKGYCDQFKDDKGNPLNQFSSGENNSFFCGIYSGMGKQVVFVPYKIIDKNTAIYWASPELKIVGRPPQLDELNDQK